MKLPLIVIVTLYLIIGALLFTLQRQLIFIGADAYESDLDYLMLSQEGADIKVYVLNSGHDDAIIYFGGNAEPVIFNVEPFKRLFPNKTTYLVNYRGYGGSSGAPTEEYLYQDALAVHDHVVKNHSQISIIGRSLGSGVATYLATQREVASLALITPFDSVESVAQAQFPIYPMFLLLRDKFDSFSRAAEIRSDTLVVIAERDQVIPKDHTVRLIDALINAQVESIVIDDADHNNVSSKAEYQQALLDFFN